MGEINVNFGSLETGAAGIMTTHGRLVTTLDELEANLQPMLQSWTGEAREAYYACKQQWDSAAEAMSTTLQQIGSLVGTAQTNYQQAENSARGNWS